MIWTFAITSAALFMVALDNLVVTTALPVIKHDLGASLSGLEWTVNAYTLTYAVLLLTGAALGDRYGRRRVFVIGLVVFVAGSAAAALAPGIGSLVVARAAQGVGGAIVTPLSLTIMSAAMPRERRGLALGAQGGVSGLGVAIGPLVGGAVVQGLSWQWIFWINVPIGLILLPLAVIWLKETTGPRVSLDLPGLGLAGAGLFGIVFGLVRGGEHGWAGLDVIGCLIAGGVLLAGFVAREMATPAPMVPMRFFRDWPFSAANLTSLMLFFGLFGSVFLLAQFFQIVQGDGPLQAGLRILPWTAAPILVAPIAGIASDRIGSRPLLVSGMVLMSAGLAWLAAITTPTVAYVEMIAPFLLAGVGMSLMFAPISNVVLSSVTREEEGKASGVNNTVREVGGVFGVSVLATVFAVAGGYATPQAFVDGLTAAVWVGAAVVGLGALAAMTVPGRPHLVPRPNPAADEPAPVETHAPNPRSPAAPAARPRSARNTGGEDQPR